MKNSDYPDLYQAANQASLAAQQTHTQLFRADLGFLISAAVLSSLKVMTTLSIDQFLGKLAILALLLSLACKVTMRYRRYDRAWFDCRAIAESIKTVTWRYMMGVPPYELSLDIVKADALFIKELGDIRKARANAVAELASHRTDGSLLTPAMKRTRSQALSERKLLYLGERLKEQMDWYRTKAKYNHRASEYSFRILIVIQLIALVLGGMAISDQAMSTIVPLMIVIATAVSAWSEMRRYNDLANSYSLASDDLAMASAVWDHISDETQLQQSVMQAEEAISREHTIWLAKRST